MERDELASWLRLTSGDGVGNATARKLLARFGLPHEVLAQPPHRLHDFLSPAHAASLRTVPPALEALIEATWAWLRADVPEGSGRRAIFVLGDPAYPTSLLAMEDPPLMLYALGRTELWPTLDTSRCLAVVGSRNPTPQGEATARDLSRGCVQAGLTVVSGLALGIDSAAHHGALEGVAARTSATDGIKQDGEAGATHLATVAVVGTGLDRVYPRRNLALAHRIASHGLILSEYKLGTPPLPANFPRRNRIIAGLGRGTLVVEAALQSGSLITARLASEQGKDVFAVPGSIHSLQSRGCHALIKQGAKLVENLQDVLDEIEPIGGRRDGGAPAAGETASDPEAAVDPFLTDLGYDPIGLDALVARTGISAAQLQVKLLELELDGQVARLPGGLFQRTVAT
jgi:DNA processing protein